MLAARRGERAHAHTVLLLEHPHVYTLGKSGDVRHLLLREEELCARGVSFYKIDRGGDITYHGPGQLVAYFLLDLNRIYRDLHRLLRALEEIVILTCADFQLRAMRVSGRTGVWIQADQRGMERKICAMGIRCSRWITMHGLALNVATDLSYYDGIIPCGIADRTVTSFARERGVPMDMSTVKDRLVYHFEEVFGIATSQLMDGEAIHYLGSSAGVETVRDLLPSKRSLTNQRADAG